MKSVRLHFSGELRLQDEPIPLPGKNQKLIRVKAVGICGSDLHWFDEARIGASQDEKLLFPLPDALTYSGRSMKPFAWQLGVKD